MYKVRHCNPRSASLGLTLGPQSKGEVPLLKGRHLESGGGSSAGPVFLQRPTEEDRTNRPTYPEPKNQTCGITQHRREAAALPLVDRHPLADDFANACKIRHTPASAEARQEQGTCISASRGRGTDVAHAAWQRICELRGQPGCGHLEAAARALTALMHLDISRLPRFAAADAVHAGGCFCRGRGPRSAANAWHRPGSGLVPYRKAQPAIGVRIGSGSK